MKKITILFHTQTKHNVNKRFARDILIKLKKKLAQAGRWGGEYLIPKSTFFSKKTYLALL